MIVRYYAAARAAAGVSEERVDASTLGKSPALGDLPTLAHLRATLLARHDDRYATVLAASALRRDGLTLLDDSLVLDDADVVEVLPPFAGG